MAVMSPAHPEFRKLLIDQFLQLVRDAAEGLQVDKEGIMWPLDFNSKLPVSPDKSLPQGVLDTYAEILPKRARSIRILALPRKSRLIVRCPTWMFLIREWATLI